ncbi:FHF complex subunit HOOK interacting protein 2A-like isoform X1 [Pieris napi]|uniref:FHF complex subunit HOOK interacting protein 2A-like isoform X1 n=1 Tax=Pieris napi TaxID=78633 RepID=UPI001FB901CE|nr:FHF complex subunit HOOK interacting protein 2A-like isoform X1 [Pieris napi]
MLSRFSDVLQTAADVLAPPATKYEDFEYHWKMIVNFYQAYDETTKVHIEDTRVPHHLHQMFQLIVDEEKEQQGGTVGPCLEAVVQRSIGVLDALAVLAVTDRPPGARAMALNLATTLLRRTQQPCLNSVHVYRPLQRMLVQCNESPASPTEKEEVELLLTICGLVRKESGLANIFTTPFIEDRISLMSIPEDIQQLIPVKRKVNKPKKNPLFDVDMTPPIKMAIVRKDSFNNSAADDASVKSQKTVYDDNDKFLLIDLLLSYLNSADNQVVLRACEGIMIVSSLPEDDIANLITSCSPCCETIVDKLCTKYRAIPNDVDPNDVDHLNITWAYVAQDFGDKSYNKFHGYRELTSFFSWLDYCDTLMKECHPTIAAHLARTFRSNFLEGVESWLLPASNNSSFVHQAALTTALLAKCLRVIDSSDLINEFSNWLVGDGEVSEWPLLLALINNCLTEDYDLTLETLRFFETIIERGTEHSMDRIVVSRVISRGYYSPPGPATVDTDERDRLNDLSFGRERDRNREAMKQLEHEDAINEQISDILSHEGLDNKEQGENVENIHRVINSFLLVLPRALLSDPVGADYEHYIHDAQRHYQLWLDITASFHWPSEPNWMENTASSTHSYDSRPEADFHFSAFDTLHTDTKKLLSKELTDEDQSKAQSTDKDVKDDVKSDTSDTTDKRISQTIEDEFDEGPFFKMIFKLLSRMPDQPYQVNLHLTSIISKLALLPHPNLHEYLLNPNLPTSKNTRTLFKTLQNIARRLTLEIPRMKNYKKIIENTRQQLMSEDPSYDISGDHNELVESLIVLEEFCKELAAIAFVKYQHILHMHR